MLADIAERAQKIKDELVLGIDDDTNAFNSFMEARRLPARSAQEKEFREQKMQEGVKEGYCGAMSNSGI